MKTKRILSALLCMIMVLSMVPFAASAEGETLTLTVSSFEDELAGLETFEVTVDVANNPGIAILGFNVNYDAEAMTLTEVANGELFNDADFTAGDLNSVPYVVSVMTNPLRDVTDDGCLVTLKFEVKDGAVTGEYAVTLTGAEAYNLNEDVVEVAAVDGTVKYKDAPMTGLALEDKTVTYDGQAHTLEVVGAPEGATVTWSSTDPMINAGTYNLTATVEAAGYETEELTATLTIKPKALTADFTVAEKNYDGTTDATVTPGALEGIIGDDEVYFVNTINAQFADKNAGVDKAVTITEPLTGADAGNYTIDAGELTATITPKAITLDSVNGDSKNATFTGLLGNDDLTLNFNNVAFNVGESSTEAVLDTNDDIFSGADAANYVLSNTGADGLVTVPATVNVANLAKLTVAFNGDDAATANITSGSYFIKGSSITITATTSDSKKYKFNAWYEGADKKSTAAEYTFVINADTALTAKFTKKNVNNVASVAPGVLPGIQDKKPTTKPAAIPAAKSIEIKLTIGSKAIVKNGTTYELDVPAQIVDNRTLVPLRAIFEALGATVEWDEATRTVTSTKGGTTVKLTIGDNKIYVNGVTRELDVPAQIINSRTMVPTRAIAEAYGCAVEWDESARVVTVKK